MKDFFDHVIDLIVGGQSNILLYGYGSKIKLIYEFVNHFQTTFNFPNNFKNFTNINDTLRKYSYSEYDILVINCFNSDITLRFILNEIEELLFKKYDEIGKNIRKEYKKTSCKNIYDQLKFFEEFFSEFIDKYNNNSRILLTLVNIDNVQFMNNYSQNFLSQIAKISGIQVICTIDNLNTDFYWTQTIKENFQFYFLNVNTYVNYDLEINENYNLTDFSNIKGGEGLKEVIFSLNNNQRY